MLRTDCCLICSLSRTQRVVEIISCMPAVQGGQRETHAHAEPAPSEGTTALGEASSHVGFHLCAKCLLINTLQLVLQFPAAKEVERGNAPRSQPLLRELVCRRIFVHIH